MEERKQGKHDEISQVYRQMNDGGRKALIRVADKLLKTQVSIQKDKSVLGEGIEQMGP
jgi:hypothetical protein